MKSFFAALQFLTVIPLPRAWAGGEKNLEKSVRYFPLVGLLIGALVAAADFFLGILLPPLAATVITVLLLTAITGGLHLDGLADTADGFFSARPREKMLEIMRDSRIGTMGVTAVFFVLGLKVAALLPLPVPTRQVVIILMPLAGRSSLIYMMTVLSYARPEGGLAGIFVRRRSPWISLAALVFLMAAGWLLGRTPGLVVVLAAAVVTMAFVLYVFRKIGGFTGDTLGAVSEVTEVAVAIAAAAWLHLGMPGS